MERFTGWINYCVGVLGILVVIEKAGCQIYSWDAAD